MFTDFSVCLVFCETESLLSVYFVQNLLFHCSFINYDFNLIGVALFKRRPAGPGMRIVGYIMAAAA
jgi:hypothetical protein